MDQMCGCKAPRHPDTSPGVCRDDREQAVHPTTAVNHKGDRPKGRNSSGTDDPNVPEDELNAQEVIREIEEGHANCKPADLGRMPWHWSRRCRWS